MLYFLYFMLSYKIILKTNINVKSLIVFSYLQEKKNKPVL